MLELILCLAFVSFAPPPFAALTFLFVAALGGFIGAGV